MTHGLHQSLARGLTGLALVFPLQASAQITNAPVAPEAIYVGRTGGHTGLSVIDLNGFGGGTGNPHFDPTFQSFAEGDSYYPLNPNLRFQGLALYPPLAPGTNTRTGGSSGVFTLVRNSALETRVVDDSVLGSVSDMMLGHALDSVFHEAPPPFGCQSGGGHLCALDGLGLIEVALGPGNVLQPAIFGGRVLNRVRSRENPISWAPHPNPPPLVFPPLCEAPYLPVQEPTSVDALLAGNVDLLVPGDPFGDPNKGVPPSGLLGVAQRSFFVGPSSPQQHIGACNDYQVRQAIGHFLYVADRASDAIVVLNSNTMQELARIPMEDPTELAMSPDLHRLAVTQSALDQVSFVAIRPSGADFHQVVAVTAVGDAPSGIAWDPGDEDVLVCCEGSDQVWILASDDLQARKVVERGLDRPFALAITQRQVGFGFEREVYFAYILDRSGRVSIFESGPDGSGGWGFDEIIGRTEFSFARPKAIQPDPLRLGSGVWIAHEGQLDADGNPTGMGGGAVSNLVLDSAVFGKILLGPTDTPHLRDLSFHVAQSVGSDELTGLPLDLAFDDLFNFGALENVRSDFSHGFVAELNGKSQVRDLGGAGIVATNQASYLLLPVRRAGGEGAVDVIELANGTRLDVNPFQAGVQSIPAAGARVVMGYYRQ